ncbi:uncharacterized protein N7479_007340 [Penicillium vulpinum]|uniref:uncharacterized protein n=1 Tax=Penicillium vulpinum TaxID=29845 RepID=UPI00254802BD|nr:uncharacterized protein N7479_007340 [Penicillium vulpinum]KAJ5960190.1 hypothetical protein N7479_007340 [Penicillium vulpinum]
MSYRHNPHLPTGDHNPRLTTTQPYQAGSSSNLRLTFPQMEQRANKDNINIAIKPLFQLTTILSRDSSPRQR